MKKCEVCGGTELPGGGTSCCHGTCIVCEDCMCSFCDSNDTCEKHCDCLKVCYECDDDLKDEQTLEAEMTVNQQLCDECEINNEHESLFEIKIYKDGNLQ